MAYDRAMISELVSQYREWQQARQAQEEKELREGQVKYFRSLVHSPDFRFRGERIDDAEEFAQVIRGMHCIATTSDLVQGEVQCFWRQAEFFHDEKGVFYYKISCRFRMKKCLLSHGRELF